MKKIFLQSFTLLITFLSFSQNIESKIDAILFEDYKKNEPGIAILVAKNGESIYRKAIGSSNLKINSPIGVESLFQIGSITKQFTAVSILMLEEKGLLNIKDKVIKHLPEYPELNKNISIYHLLNHTSGLKNETPVGDKIFVWNNKMSSKNIIDYFIKKPLAFQPGESFKYSNAGYILLGRIIENLTGESFESFIKNNIFLKLGINASYNEANKTKGYEIKNNTFVGSGDTNLALAYSAGAIVTTVNDMLKWHNALQSNLLISATSLEKATSPTALNNGKKIPYGLGFRIANLNGSKIVAHAGSTKGFTSIALYLPKEDIFISALTNCNCKNVNNVAKKVAELFLPKNLKKGNQKKESISIPSKILEMYVGDYEVRPGVVIKIGETEKNRLYLLAPNQTKKIELFAETKNHFFMNVSNAKITFNHNEKGDVLSLTMHQSGKKVIAKRK